MGQRSLPESLGTPLALSKRAMPASACDIDCDEEVRLFLEELTKTVIESGLLREECDRYALDGPLPQFAIPATLHGSLVARLDRLGSVRHVAQMMREAGLDPGVDEFGNLIGLGAGGDGPVLLAGSHLDTVPDGGMFDGALGVVAAVEAAQTLRDAGRRLRHRLGVIAFADEEGDAFSVGTLSSRALVGEIPRSRFETLRDRSGKSLEAYGSLTLSCNGSLPEPVVSKWTCTRRVGSAMSPGHAWPRSRIQQSSHASLSAWAIALVACTPLVRTSRLGRPAGNRCHSTGPPRGPVCSSWYCWVMCTGTLMSPMRVISEWSCHHWPSSRFASPLTIGSSVG